MNKNGILIRTVTLLAAIVIAVSCFAGCGSNDDRVYRTYKELKEDGNVKIGVTSDNTPFGFADENGDYQGYEIRFADRLAKELGLKVKFVSTEIEDRAKYLETGKVDIVIADYAVEKTAKKAVDFAKPYMKRALGAVSADENKVDSIESLGKKDKVIVVSGSAAAKFMTESYPKVKLCECADENEAIDAIISNKGILWLTENTNAAEFAVQNDDFSLRIAEIGDVLEYAPAVTKGNGSLLKKINKAIDKLNKEGFFSTDYQESLKNVFGKNFESNLLIGVENEDAEETTSASESTDSTEGTTSATQKTTSTAKKAS
ncbi:MAG: transporter substrate-binding domain-containing protein [Ruminococcus sp.]|nr:transporter substrate-binding domain-containing protein [Ruminococcus sp.]